MKSTIVSLALLAATSIAAAQTVIVNDTFNGPVLDTATWQVVKPFGTSSVTINGGSAYSDTRGILATVAEIQTPYVLSGAFNIPSTNGIFSISLRSSLVTGGDFGVPSGLSINFVNGSDIIQFATYTNAGVGSLIISNIPFALANGASYQFEVIDDGSSVSLAINGTPLFSNVATTFATGAHIGLYGSQSTGIGSNIESVTITTSAVPEPASFAALAGLGVLGLAATRRRRAA